MTTTEVDAFIRMAIIECTRETVPPKHAKFAVFLESGHSDVGATGHGDVVREVSSYKAACELLSKERERIIAQFICDIIQVRTGEEEGLLIDDGSYQFANAQIVARGEADQIIPVSGFAVLCNPAYPTGLTANEWANARWSDFFDDGERK